MAKLSGSKIIEEVNNGNINISPFNINNVGPNSYDLTLGDTLLTYAESCLDPKHENSTFTHIISDNGFVLTPNMLYLGCTNEIAGSNVYVPCIEGRSSLARLGVQIHLTAGFGDVGFIGKWTLEIIVTQPVVLYKNMRICQIYFDTIIGNIDTLYNGKYAKSNNVVSSRSYIDKEWFNGK